MTLARTRRRRPARFRGSTTVLLAVALVLLATGALEHFAGSVAAALADGLTAGFIAGRAVGGPRPRRRRRP